VLVGPLVDASAYAFAPQTVIAPFASLDVLLNFLTAPCTLRFQRERLTWKHLLATIMVTGGASSAAYFGSSPEQSQFSYKSLCQELLKYQSLLYFAFESLVVVTSLAMLRRAGRAKGLILGAVAGILMGNVFFVKGFVDLIRGGIEDNDWSAFLTVTPYVLLFGAAGGSIMGTFFMQRGLREHKGVYMVTIFEGAHITAACLSGSIVMGELVHSTWSIWAAYWGSVALIIFGIALISSASTDTDFALSFVPASLARLSNSMISEHTDRRSDIGDMNLSVSDSILSQACDQPSSFIESHKEEKCVVSDSPTENRSR